MQEKPTPPCIHVDEPIKPIDVSSVPSPKLVFPCVIRAHRSKFTRHIGAKQAKKQLKYELDRTPPANYLLIFRKLLCTPLNAFPSGVYEHFIADLLFRIRKHSVPESLIALSAMEAYTNETQQQLSSVAPEGSLPQPTDP